ncbi:MAG: LPS-assembly protein LptD [Opitutales bacterium]
MPRNARFIYPLLLALSLPSLEAALPELSSIEPIEFDEASQRVVARGDARLDLGEARLRADRITYYQEYGLADAAGNVAITREGDRFLANRMSYEVENNIFSVDFLKTGQWPLYIDGISAGGDPDDLNIEGATVYYGNPGKLTPNISAGSLEYVDGEDDFVRLRKATLRVGNIPIFHLPGYTHYLTSSPFHFEFSAGEDNRLGTYAQSTALMPVSSFLRIGGNFDYYTKRGPLAGPAAQYVYDSEAQRIVGAFSTGFIDDQGDSDELGVDRLDRPIQSSREFAQWRHRHQIGERFSATASINYWSDSEITRDFREDYYADNQLPDNFAEAAYTGDNYIVSAFGRFNFNDFQLVQERLPEIRLDVLPVPIFETGAYHRASASYARLREEWSDVLPGLTDEDSEADRLDLTYRIERPFHLTPWLSLTPLGGARLTHYENQFQDAALPFPAPAAGDGQREIFEAGFDLEMRAFHSYETKNRTWSIDGLRHMVKPVLRYRYFSDPDDLAESVSIDRQVFDLERPVLDLSDLRNIDQISETHLARLGLENLFQTRAESYGSRTLATLNFYQDILFEKKQRFDGGEEQTFDSTWAEFSLRPAPWLKFDLTSRFKTESLSLDELRTRLVLTSGEIWELGLGTDLIDSQIDQYRVDLLYRLSERRTLRSDIRFDADNGELTALRLGLSSRLGTVWEVLYALTFREGARREDDVSFGVSLRLIDPQF